MGRSLSLLGVLVWGVVLAILLIPEYGAWLQPRPGLPTTRCPFALHLRHSSSGRDAALGQAALDQPLGHRRQHRADGDLRRHGCQHLRRRDHPRQGDGSGRHTSRTPRSTHHERPARRWRPRKKPRSPRRPPNRNPKRHPAQEAAPQSSESPPTAAKRRPKHRVPPKPPAETAPAERAPEPAPEEEAPVVSGAS